MSDYVEIISFADDQFLLIPFQQGGSGSGVILYGLESQMPSPGVIGRLYVATDKGITYFDNVSQWIKVGVSRHVDLQVGADEHPEYIKASGTRDFTGHVKLFSSAPTHDSHAASKSFVEEASLKAVTNNVRISIGVGFIPGVISTGAVFGRRPIGSDFGSNWRIRAFLLTARVAGTSTTAIQFQIGVGSSAPTQFHNVQIGANVLFKEEAVSIDISGGQYITAICTQAGGHSGILADCVLEIR